MKIAFAWTFAVLTFLSLSAGAQEASEVTCVNDKEGIKGAKSQAINTSIERAQDALSKAFEAYQADCEKFNTTGNSSGPKSKAFLLLGDLASGINKPEATYIKKSCIEASLQRDVAQDGYVCEGKKPKEFKNSGGSKVPCLNQNSVDYIHFSVNLALRCFASIRDPIDARFMLKKINTETAFNFYLSSSGGTGIGQSTSWPVKDLAGKKKNQGNARGILEDLEASNDPACKAFHEVVKKDLTTPPPTPPARNVCSYVGADKGFARALVYSMGYYIFNRDEVIKPYLESNKIVNFKSKDPRVIAKSKEALNYATLLSYGPDGPNGAKAYMDSMRISSPAKAVEKIKKKEYVESADKRMAEELLPKLKPKDQISKDDLMGNTCVTH